MDFITSACYKNLLFVSALLANLGWLVRGQTPTTTTAPDPALFFAIIVVVAIIAVILIGAVVALIIICFVYYCCSPVPNPDHVNVRTNPNSEGEPIEVLDPLPPDYVDHDKYPRETLSQRSRASLPRYSLIFRKTRRTITSQRDRNSDVERSSQRERTSERSRGATSLTHSLPHAIDAVEIVEPTQTEDSAV